MTSMRPSGKTTIQIEGLGTVEGWEYPNGVRQFTGIPYATLAKRWTRSQLKTSWPTGYHDGTKLGASAPNPPEYNDLTKDFLTPVPHIEHFNFPEEDEFNCLVMNICLPPSSIEGPHPVMCYIHGGSFLFGGANRAIFDGVNVCTFAFERGTPVITVNFNYRVGLGGFLASEAIRRDLAVDGYEGVGNFGLTDQQTALNWIQRYIPHVGGDKNNVTIYGESAGGMSVAHQCAAKTPAVFHRAISMSGTLNTIPSWTLEHHEKHYRALLTYLKINPNATDSLEQLRRVPQDEIAAATTNVEGVFVATGNPCLDGIFHAIPPAFDNIASPPAWLKGFMIGDVLDEAMIMRDNVSQDDISVFRDGMRRFLSDEDTETILQLYEISDQTPVEEVRLRFEDMFGDAIFKVQNYLTAHRSTIPQTYTYHFDQLSTLENPLKGLAYHAHDLLFIWLNLREKMTEGQLALADKMAGAWIDFAHGKDPWERFDVAKRWMIFGPDDRWGEKTEDEDESVRRYARSQKILDMGVYQAFVQAMDHIGVKRHRMGTFEGKL